MIDKIESSFLWGSGKGEEERGRERERERERERGKEPLSGKDTPFLWTARMIHSCHDHVL